MERFQSPAIPPEPAKRRERQIVRVLALLRFLSQGRTFSIHDLAAEFHTRRETIYRDLRVLQDAGYPIAGDRLGRLSHPRLTLERNVEQGLSSSELDALSASITQVQVALPNSTVLHTATAKLERLAKAKFKSREDATLIAGNQVLDSWISGSKQYSKSEPLIPILVEAILRRQRCYVGYRRPSAITSKYYDFDPYRLLVVDRGLYVLGKVPKHDGVVTLAVERLLTVTFTAEKFTLPPDVDLNRFRDQAFGVSWHDPQHVVLRFRADQAPYIRERIWHTSQQLKSFPDGTLEMTFCAGGPFEIRRWILGWGDAVEVISPPRLRDEIQGVAESIMALYVKRQEVCGAAAHPTD